MGPIVETGSAPRDFSLGALVRSGTNGDLRRAPLRGCGHPPSPLTATHATLGNSGRLRGMQQEGEKAGRFGDCSDRVIGACIEVHRCLGPGLLESAYEQCLAHEFDLRLLSAERQVHLPVRYKNVEIDCGYRLDFIIEAELIVEITAVERLLPVHEAQLLTYLKLTGLPEDCWSISTRKRSGTDCAASR